MVFNVVFCSHSNPSFVSPIKFSTLNESLMVFHCHYDTFIYISICFVVNPYSTVCIFFFFKLSLIEPVSDSADAGASANMDPCLRESNNLINPCHVQ